ncbi:hypothetical protein [Nocardiopsis sp. CA-288880]|uniref:hypothetical protein n=1 Tax=Nocardiopsis sp. CA-288880 TaxID=3239995 RepID=UPI003D967B71
MAKDLWEATRDKLANLFGGEGASIARDLEASRQDVLQNQDLAPVVEDEWRSRLTRHLLTHPEAVNELRELLEEIAPKAAQMSVTNQITGDVHGTAVQAANVHGGVNTNFNGGTHQHGDPLGRINAQTEAELVRIEPSFNGGSIHLHITNDGSRPVRKVELVYIARVDAAPEESWKLNPNVWNVRDRWDILKAGEEKQTFVWLLDTRGQHISNRNELKGVVYTVRFVDYEGQWWEKTADGTTRQVPSPS